MVGSAELAVLLTINIEAERESLSDLAAIGTREVSGNISHVTNAAGDTGAASGQVLQAATELSTQAERLSAEVVTFLAKARAAA